MISTTYVITAVLINKATDNFSAKLTLKAVLFGIFSKSTIK
jgi:hypothetical protein